MDAMPTLNHRQQKRINTMKLDYTVISNNGKDTPMLVWRVSKAEMELVLGLVVNARRHTPEMTETSRLRGRLNTMQNQLNKAMKLAATGKN